MTQAKAGKMFVHQACPLLVPEPSRHHGHKPGLASWEMGGPSCPSHPSVLQTQDPGQLDGRGYGASLQGQAQANRPSAPGAATLVGISARWPHTLLTSHSPRPWGCLCRGENCLHRSTDPNPPPSLMQSQCLHHPPGRLRESGHHGLPPSRGHPRCSLPR